MELKEVTPEIRFEVYYQDLKRLSELTSQQSAEITNDSTQTELIGKTPTVKVWKIVVISVLIGVVITFIAYEIRKSRENESDNEN